MPRVGKLDIVRAGNPVLRARASEVAPEELGQKPLVALVKNMVEAMRRAPGVGLAAPQLGVGKRVIVLEDAERLMAKLSKDERALRERVVFPLRAIVNPVLTVVREEPRVFFEGCLSVPGWSALVPRAAEVEVRGTDERGQPIEWRVSGWPARILQHEVDHLDGALYVDRMLSRTFGHNDEIGALSSSLSVDAIRERFGA
jgi:peptide deformylase